MGPITNSAISTPYCKTQSQEERALRLAGGLTALSALQKLSADQIAAFALDERLPPEIAAAMSIVSGYQSSIVTSLKELMAVAVTLADYQTGPTA